MAGSFLVAIPTLLIYIFLGRYFLRGMMTGVLKEEGRFGIVSGTRREKEERNLMTAAFGSMPGTGDETVQRVIEPINKARGWMKLLAVMLLISGGLAAITIVGLVFAWLPLWMGYLLWKSAKSAESAAKLGGEAEAIESLSRLKTYFTVQGVLILVYFAFTAMFIVLAIGLSLSNSSG